MWEGAQCFGVKYGRKLENAGRMLECGKRRLQCCGGSRGPPWEHRTWIRTSRRRRARARFQGILGTMGRQVSEQKQPEKSCRTGWAAVTALWLLLWQSWGTLQGSRRRDSTRWPAPTGSLLRQVGNIFCGKIKQKGRKGNYQTVIQKWLNNSHFYKWQTQENTILTGIPTNSAIKYYCS